MGLLARAFFQRGMNDMAARKLQEALKEKPVFDDEATDVYVYGGMDCSSPTACIWSEYTFNLVNGFHLML